MKKILAAALALCLLLALGACGNSDRPAPADSSDEQDAFVTPAGCVTVLQITINPQFRLYLDADDKVLAVEPLNADARSIVASPMPRRGWLMMRRRLTSSSGLLIRRR